MKERQKIAEEPDTAKVTIMYHNMLCIKFSIVYIVHNCIICILHMYMSSTTDCVLSVVCAIFTCFCMVEKSTCFFLCWIILF